MKTGEGKTLVATLRCISTRSRARRAPGDRQRLPRPAKRDSEWMGDIYRFLVGKGRKTRCTPLRTDVVAVLKEWLSQQGGDAGDPVFPSVQGGRLSADALQRLVARHVATARRACPSLTEKTVTPHTLRHTKAMDLLRGGVDLTVIALWLGHESTQTTQIYLHADMRLKEMALAHATSSGSIPKRYHAPDPLLGFLESL